MNTHVQIALRDRIGNWLRQSRVVAGLELLVVPLLLGLHAIGIFPKPKLLLLLFGWLSMWLRRVGWRQLGLSQPKSWAFTAVASIVIALAYNALDIKIILPALHRITVEPLDLAAFDTLKGNTRMLLILITASWISAAFPEEMLYRGYMLNRSSDVFGKSHGGWIISGIFVCLVFGFAHHTQGVTGVIDNVIAGALFTGLYFASNRNLWMPILVHGMIDTSSVILLYFGFHP
jgi:membrane protease YdiL (CAAX protease family)